MKSISNIVGASTLLFVSEALTNGCSLIRNILLARFLTKADFGVAASIGIVVALFELAGKMSFGQQVMRARNENIENLIDAAHSCQLLAGVLGFVFLFVAAYPITFLLEFQGNLSVFLLLSLIPLLAGFTSLDSYRQVRQMKFLPLVLIEVVPQLTITLLAWPMAMLVPSYWCIVWLLLAKSAASMITSHFLSKTSFRISRDQSLVLDSLKFSWPLLASGYLVLLNFQGDRMLVGSAFSMADLGAYAVAATMAITPGMIVLKITVSVSTPYLAKYRDDPLRFRGAFRASTQAMAFLGALMSVFAVLLGGPVITFLFGAKYASCLDLFIWLTAAQSLRILRGAILSASLVQGDTINSMLSNIWRLSGLVLAIFAVLLKMDIIWLAAAGVIGEIVAVFAALLRSSRRGIVSLGDFAVPFSFLILVVASAVLLGQYFRPFGVLMGSMLFIVVTLSLALPLLLRYRQYLFCSMANFMRRSKQT